MKYYPSIFRLSILVVFICVLFILSLFYVYYIDLVLDVVYNVDLTLNNVKYISVLGCWFWDNVKLGSITTLYNRITTIRNRILFGTILNDEKCEEILIFLSF